MTKYIIAFLIGFAIASGYGLQLVFIALGLCGLIGLAKLIVLLGTK